MLNLLKFLLLDFTTLRTHFTNFCIKFAFPRYKLQSFIKIFKFFSFAFHNINFWFKISKICPKISYFSQISHSRAAVPIGGAHTPWGSEKRFLGVREELANFTADERYR